MGTIAQNQQTTFSSPQNGDSPIDADVVRTNDNALVAKHNAHDADATLHVQTGLLASRPAASTPYAMWLDENRRLYVDNGSAWNEVPYLRLSNTSSQTMAGALDVTGTVTSDGVVSSAALTVQAGGADITGNSEVDGTLLVTGNTTINGTATFNGGLAGSFTVPAANVGGGTFPASASWRFGGGASNLKVDNTFSRMTLESMQLRQAFIADPYGSGGIVPFPTNANIAAFSLYTNGASYTIDCSSIQEPGVYYVCVVLMANVTVAVSGVSWGTVGAPTMPSAVNNILCFQVVNFATQGGGGDVNAATLLMKNY